jgi:nitrite reductase (NADH) small subunit
MDARFITVARMDELPAGSRKTAVVEGAPVALFNVEGCIYAIDDRCPHRGGPLGMGDLVGHVVHCPLHAWSFDVRTGACISNPAARVSIFEVRLHNGDVQVSRSGTLPAIDWTPPQEG